MPDDGDWEEASAQADRICELIENASAAAWDKAYEFFEDVEAKVKSVQETILRTERVTDKQQQALNNWEAGVSKWYHEEDH